MVRENGGGEKGQGNDIAHVTNPAPNEETDGEEDCTLPNAAGGCKVCDSKEETDSKEGHL